MANDIPVTNTTIVTTITTACTYHAGCVYLTQALEIRDLFLSLGDDVSMKRVLILGARIREDIHPIDYLYEHSNETATVFGCDNTEICNINHSVQHYYLRS